MEEDIEYDKLYDYGKTIITINDLNKKPFLFIN